MFDIFKLNFFSKSQNFYFETLFPKSQKFQNFI